MITKLQLDLCFKSISYEIGYHMATTKPKTKTNNFVKIMPLRTCALLYILFRPSMEEIYTFLQKLVIGNQKCDAAVAEDDTDDSGKGFCIDIVSHKNYSIQ